MIKVLMTAYAIHPYKGSEDATGWNHVIQAAKGNEIIAVTRKNNREGIEKFIKENPDVEELKRVEFMYFDFPKWMLFWKKGPFLSMIYYYIWQFSMALWLRSKKLNVDIVHNLNFHNDWTPHFLWMLGKPVIWGPVGHHPKVPKQFLLPIYGTTAYLKDRALWILKNIFWYCDPLLRVSARSASRIISLNSEALPFSKDRSKIVAMPAVGAPIAEDAKDVLRSDSFIVLSVGRFVSLKGFDLTIQSFSKFYKTLSQKQQENTKLVLVGKGPEKQRYMDMCFKLGIEDAVDFIEWMPQAEVKNLYKKASVYLFPSHEGAGMVVPEAMSYGLPVVCLDNCGPGEFLHSQSKLKVPYLKYEETVKLLSQKLIQLHGDPVFYSIEKSLSAEQFAAKLDWNKKSIFWQRIYNDVMIENKPKVAKSGVTVQPA
jgi:glycosyltransferase involved in cell wall biosynthesis